MIRIRPTQDGTYTVYRDGRAVASGLTRSQAEAAAREYGVPLPA